MSIGWPYYSGQRRKCILIDSKFKNPNQSADMRFAEVNEAMTIFLTTETETEIYTLERLDEEDERDLFYTAPQPVGNRKRMEFLEDHPTAVIREDDEKWGWNSLYVVKFL